MEYINLPHRLYDSFLDIYTDSFPPEERRPYSGAYDLGRFMESHKGQFRILAAEKKGRLLGFITYWLFDTIAYIEHFAIASTCRGRNLGSSMLRHFSDHVNSDIILEVEPPEDEISRRRIGFYRRLGFTLHEDYHYIQPPYDPALPSLPLKLMTHGDARPTPQLITRLHRDVYNVK